MTIDGPKSDSTDEYLNQFSRGYREVFARISAETGIPLTPAELQIIEDEAKVALSDEISYNNPIISDGM